MRRIQDKNGIASTFPADSNRLLAFVPDNQLDISSRGSADRSVFASANFAYMPSGKDSYSTIASSASALAQSSAAPESGSNPIGILGVTPDEAGDGIGAAPGNPLVLVDAPAATIGTVGTIGDQDYYAVNLVAGTTYEISVLGYYPGGPSLLPLSDAYVELYSATGQLLGSADGGATTDLNIVNSGFDAVLTFTATATGTYYVNARAFDQDATNGTTGDFLGDYELRVSSVDPNDPSVYHPYYEASSPLYAIDWGTQVNRINQSARNPDGNEGTRDTGNAPGTPIYNVNNVAGLDVQALAQAQGKDISGKNVVTIYFAQAGDVFTSIEDPTSPGLPPVLVSLGTQQFERDTVWTALHEFEKVADVVYLEVNSRDKADFFFTTYAGTPGPGASLLGSMSPPDYPDEGLAQFNSNDQRWNATNLAQGGFSFVTLIHEFGHGHGLAHPHDNGGHSGIMNGVESEGVVADYTLGDFALNQGVFTMMSYEDGWQSSPYGNAATNVGYGYLGGLMAFDIAAIQDKYGVNESWANGNDTYVMKDVNAAGTFFYSIWDSGGIDAIVYGGARNTTIDLRPATLQYEVGGGGRVSFADGIFGGYTIANGVTIENASSGSGNDILNGNDAGNTLDGGAGTDQMFGFGGNDFFFVRDAGDQVFELANGGTDQVLAAVSWTLTVGSRVEYLSTTNHSSPEAINLTGNELAQTIYGNNGANWLDGGGGGDVMLGRSGNDFYFIRNGADLVYDEVGEGSGDRVFAAVSWTLNAGAQIEIMSTTNHGSTEAINLKGNELNQQIFGNEGANRIDGGHGADSLEGRGGADIFAFTTSLGGGNIDVITDFALGIDKLGFAGVTQAQLAAGAFRTGTAAQDADDRIIYNQATGALFYDGDGNGSAAAVQFATIGAGLNLSANDFVTI